MPGGLPWGCYLSRQLKNQLLLKFCNLPVKAINILFADKTN